MATPPNHTISTDELDAMDRVLEVAKAEKVSFHPDLAIFLKYSLHLLRRNLWNTTVPTGLVWDLKAMDVMGTVFEYTDSKLLVLQQYPAVLDRIQTLRSTDNLYPPHGLLITGSPGIGKTSFLWYLLVINLCHAKPVVLYYSSQLFVFTTSSVYCLDESNAEILFNKVFAGVLCLVDLDENTNLKLQGVVLSKHSKCFTVAASSPSAGRYKDWRKQSNIWTIVFGPPTLEELKFLFGIRMKVDDIEFNVDRHLRRLLDIFGPNIRDMMAALNNPSDDRVEHAIQVHISDIRAFLTGLGDAQLKLLFTTPDDLPGPFSHTLIHTYGTPSASGFDMVKHRIRSPLILRLVLESSQKSRLTPLREMYNLFSASSHLAVSRGWVFEVLAHAKICSTTKLTLQPLLEERHHLKRDENGTSVDVFIGERLLEIYSQKSQRDTTISNGHYYVPAEGNNPTFDAFLPGDLSLVFQMFIGRTHGFTQKGVGMFRKRIRAFDKNRNWEESKINFVFVVPVGYEFRVDAPARPLKDVEFYLLELQLENYERFYDPGEPEDESDDDDGEMDLD